jgi:hypothetical protein
MDPTKEQRVCVQFCHPWEKCNRDLGDDKVQTHQGEKCETGEEQSEEHNHIFFDVKGIVH